MDVARTGIIFYVQKYKECLVFYTNILKLNILFKNETLTCFDLFGTYLMIEKEDRPEYLVDKNTERENFSCIRINIINVKQIADDLIANDIDVDYQEHDWGIVAKFFDPEGNLLAFKDEESFAKQIKNYVF
ncbi:VOC family protein [Aquimarina sp. AU474]|uniref:VOC family protein n=1 Tax=Aquimarina sp. AU474 TaxID=2108529 RepID=UPI000D68FAFF|nr:glyoxalase/bleomycin resistance/dioxygenase family protein [Aquimarina sp. AU474]